MYKRQGLTLATDAYGPISDNAGGNAEMSKLDPEVLSLIHIFSINQKIDKKLIEIPKSMWSGTFLHFIKTHNLKNSISIDDYAYRCV